MKDDTISRWAAIKALWKALYDYEDKTEKQFQESDELDVCDWIQHRIFVRNMSDIDRQVILELPSAQPERKKGHWIATEYYEWKCSECDCVVEDEEPTWNFCPNCGIRMEYNHD